jgi:chromosome partitioning protein
MLALHGIRVLIVGLDSAQESITTCALPSPQQSDSLEDLLEESLGLYHHLIKGAPLEKVIKRTSLPTLDVIPETPELSRLEVEVRGMRKREHTLANKIVEYINHDVILFDNGAGWNSLVENSLVASKTIIFPMGCSIEAYRAVNKNLSMVLELEKEMGIKWENFIQVATLLEKTSLSEKIYKSYLKNHSENMVPFPIRHAVVGQEASTFHRSVIEHAPNSSLAQDYYAVIESIWQKING